MKPLYLYTIVVIVGLLMLSTSIVTIKQLALKNESDERPEKDALDLKTIEILDCKKLLFDCPYCHQITEDLNPFTQGINSTLIKEALDALPEGIRIKVYIRDNRFFVEKNHSASNRRWKGMILMLLKVSCFVELPDVDIVLYLNDLYEEYVPLLPIFHFQKIKNGTGILLPFFSHLNDLETFHSESKKIIWSTKRSQAIWRGATTGGTYDLSNWHTYPRSKLVHACTLKRLQHICDASFYKIVQATDEASDVMLKNLSLKDPIPLNEQMKYKYILSLDGNGACAGRFEQLLSGNSLIMKADSDSIEFYYGGLLPNVHYVPVKTDMSDLEDKLLWLTTHDEHAKDIVFNMEDYASHLSTRHVACYVQSLLDKYSRLITFKMEPLESLLNHVDHILPGQSVHNSNAPSSCVNPIYACQNKNLDDEIQVHKSALKSLLCSSYST
jgi:EGF-domain serine glucosyl/xylosyltransferase